MMCCAGSERCQDSAQWMVSEVVERVGARCTLCSPPGSSSRRLESRSEFVITMAEGYEMVKECMYAISY